SRFDLMSDDGYGTEKGPAHLVQRGEVTPSNMGYLAAPWAEFYSTISSCNRFFDKMQGENLQILTAQDEDHVNRMMGEMKFLRAYSYFRLLSIYGGVPLVKESFQLDDNFLVPRSSYDEVLDFVVSELDEAAAL